MKGDDRVHMHGGRRLSPPVFQIMVMGVMIECDTAAELASVEALAKIIDPANSPPKPGPGPEPTPDDLDR